MNSGMLWYDSDPRTPLPVKVERAAEYFHRKYGRAPDICLVHPSMLIEKDRLPKSIAVRAFRQVRPGYFWIGTEDN